jgi:circadian clock protein KaiC
MDQMQEPGGVFDQVVEAINCKRIVIDSVSLFQYGVHGANVQDMIDQNSLLFVEHYD